MFLLQVEFIFKYETYLITGEGHPTTVSLPLNALKTLFRLNRVLLRRILSGAIKFASFRSS